MPAHQIDDLIEAIVSRFGPHRTDVRSYAAEEGGYWCNFVSVDLAEDVETEEGAYEYVGIDIRPDGVEVDGPVRKYSFDSAATADEVITAVRFNLV